MRSDEPVNLRLDREHTALLIIDVQERLASAMEAAEFAKVMRNIGIMVETAGRLGLPIVVSEQYPKGLGATCGPIESALQDAGSSVSRFEKVEFSVCAAESFSPIWSALSARGIRQWLVCGMETHICVYQSARDLVAKGASVQVVGDAVISRAEHNYQTGLAMATTAGAVVTSTETAVMDLLVRAVGEDFKAISKAIR